MIRFRRNRNTERSKPSGLMRCPGLRKVGKNTFSLFPFFPKLLAKRPVSGLCVLTAASQDAYGTAGGGPETAEAGGLQEAAPMGYTGAIKVARQTL
jgi:hypothetical protein